MTLRFVTRPKLQRRDWLAIALLFCAPALCLPAQAETLPEPNTQAEPSTLKPPLETAIETSLDATFLTHSLDNSLAQVTSVSQLRDVQPTDWAFQALQSLVERYGCLAGYPDASFRGNRALTRYEFAAGLNACLDRVQALIAEQTRDRPSADDLAVMQRLQEEFQAELATLRGRIDGLEARVGELETSQFSPTTRLSGQAVMAVQGRSSNQADFFPVDGVKDTDDPGTNVNVISTVQLNLLTQFSPNSLLLIGLQAGDGSTAPRLSSDSRLAYEGPTDRQLVLTDLTYRHRLSNNLALIVGSSGVNPVGVFRGANRVESSGFGPLSAFAQRNPILNLGAGTAGAGFDWQATPWLSLQGVYASNLANDAARGGLFGGQDAGTTWGFQLAATPSERLDIALNYLNSYSPNGNLRTGLGEDQLTTGAAIQTQAIGGTAAWRLSPKLTLGGWGGYTTSNRLGASGSVETFNWMAFANFPDLFGEGNLGGIYVGQPPKISSSDLPLGENIPSLLAGGPGTAGGQSDSTTHIELFYRYQLSNNIAITPGVIVLLNPGNAGASDPITIGAVRTSFRF